MVLGSGTSNGVPTLGKPYPATYLADPRNFRTRAALALLGPTGNVLVDCGPDMRSQLLREGIVDVEGVFITHTHADHVMGMDDLRSFCLKYKRSVPVYTSPDYQEDIRRIFSYAFREYPPGIWVPRLELLPVEPHHRLAGLEIKTFWLEHGPIPVLGLRVNDFAYLTDVSAIPDNVWPCLSGLDTLVLDAVRLEPHPNHFHLESALSTAQKIGAKETYLTHLCDDYDHSVTNASLPSGIELAFDGLRVEL